MRMKIHMPDDIGEVLVVFHRVYSYTDYPYAGSRLDHELVGSEAESAVPPPLKAQPSPPKHPPTS